MKMRLKQNWIDYANACAFIGNSLLSPINRTEKVGLNPEFWEQFPSFNNAEMKRLLERCANLAQSVRAGKDGMDACTWASVEYTHLFIGPPKPAAPPWETFYRNDVEATVGFGQATFEMQQLLREAGLKISNENNQYADHMGIELLLLNVYCMQVVEQLQNNNEQEAENKALAAASYAHERIGSWIDAFAAKVAEAAPGGYFDHLLQLEKSLIKILE
jgi:putative dimethyl sulfoxide reductase chaperone